MLLKLFQAGEPVLRAKAKKVTKANLNSVAIQQLIDLMIDTVRDYPGVGLAAPQVGESFQIIVIEDKKKYQKDLPANLLSEQGRKQIGLQVLVNPVIKIIDSEPLHYFEGCLSVAGYRAVVPRARIIEIKAWDRHGKAIKIIAKDYFARIVQHEIDHLNGTLYSDKMIKDSFMSNGVYSKKWSTADSQKIKQFL